jgi:hypothetical protein
MSGASCSTSTARPRRQLVSPGSLGELVQQLLEGAAGIGEAVGSDHLRPVLFDLGDPVAGVVQRLAAAPGGKINLARPSEGSGRRSR